MNTAIRVGLQSVSVIYYDGNSKTIPLLIDRDFVKLSRTVHTCLWYLLSCGH